MAIGPFRHRSPSKRIRKALSVGPELSIDSLYSRILVVNKLLKLEAPFLRPSGSAWGFHLGLGKVLP